MEQKKVRQGIIPYEADKFEIGFEGNSAEGYAHVVSESEDPIFDTFKVQDTLNPFLWKDDKLSSRVRLKLLDIADDFTDFLDVDWVKPEDITFTGSLANYNWSEYSDIDLHIIIDYKKVDDRTDFVKNYFNSKKELWNNSHPNLTIYDFPIELYVQDKNEPHASSGVYSLEKNKWLIKPKKMKPASEKDIDKAEKLSSEWEEKIEKLLSRYNDSSTDSQKEKVLDGLDDIFTDIKDDRKEGFKNGGNEMNPKNLAFKALRRNGYLDKIWDKKSEIYDDLNSLNEGIENYPKIYHQTSTDFNIIKSIIENGLIPQDRNDEGNGIWFMAGEPFYTAKATTFSLPDTEETFKKYAFHPFYDGDIRIARKPIPFEDLTVEVMPFGLANEKTTLFSDVFTSPKSFIEKKIQNCGSIAKYIAENKTFTTLLIYVDLFEMFVEKGTSHIFSQYPHIKTDTLLK